MCRLFLVIIVLLLIIGGGIVGLYERPLPKADFTYAAGDSIKTLDPARMRWNEDIRVALGLWEGLAAYHPETTQAIPGAAYAPRISEDGLTYSFQLRPDGRWSNGDPVTADDFIYAWRRAIEPGTAGDYAFLISENIEGAKDYAAWRNRSVRILTTLRDLAQNSTVTPEDRQFVLALHLPGMENEKPDWIKIADRFRREHLARMDSEFDKVALKAIGDYHLQVKLTRPIAYFHELVAFSTFLPVHKKSLEKLRLRDDPIARDITLWLYDPQWVKPDYHHNGYPGLVTNGSFRLVAWQFKRYLYLQKNPCYWDHANVRSDSIMVQIITEPSTSFLAYERGDIDWLRDLTRLDFAPALVEQSQRRSRDDIHIVTAFGTYFYDFNCTENLPDGTANPFHDPRLRMAFNIAVDKQAIAAQVKKVGNKVARNYVPPGSIAGYYCAPCPDYNPQKARQLLTQAGYDNGRGLPTVEILYNTGFGHEKVAEAIAQMWKKNLNVKVSTRGKELKSFDEDKRNQRYMVCRASWYGDYTDPTTFLDMFLTDNGNNDTGFSHPEYDKIMRQAAQCLDPEERMKILARAETIIMQEQMPVLPIYYYVNLMAYRKNVKGIFPNARSMYPFKYIYTHHD